MRLKLANERSALKEAAKAKEKVVKLTSDIEVKQVRIDDLEAKLEESEHIRSEQRARMKTYLDRASKLEEELKELREARDGDPSSEIQDLRDEVALVRIVARAALMRRFVAGQIPREAIEEELASFREQFGSDELLDADDAKDAEAEEEEALKEPEVVVGEEIAKEAVSGSDPTTEVTEEASAQIAGSDAPPEVAGQAPSSPPV